MGQDPGRVSDGGGELKPAWEIWAGAEVPEVSAEAEALTSLVLDNDDGSGSGMVSSTTEVSLGTSWRSYMLQGQGKTPGVQVLWNIGQRTLKDIERTNKTGSETGSDCQKNWQHFLPQQRLFWTLKFQKQTEPNQKWHRKSPPPKKKNKKKNKKKQTKKNQTIQ